MALLLPDRRFTVYCDPVRCNVPSIHRAAVDMPPMCCVDLVSGQRGPFPILELTKARWTCPPPLDA
jgi:hypothetical protein